jgi:hypothetical protein
VPAKQSARRTPRCKGGGDGDGADAHAVDGSTQGLALMAVSPWAWLLTHISMQLAV